MGKGTFNVADRAAELVPAAVEVKDRTFKVNRSGDAMEKVMGIDTGPEDASDTELAGKSVEVLYTSLSYLLEDGEGKNPDPDWLKSNIDFEVGSILLEELMPGSDRVSPPAPGPETQSTPGSGESH